MADSTPDTRAAEAAATQRNMISLSEMILIGTMGTDDNRRALVRFPGGRITEVTVGDLLRGKPNRRD